MSLATIARAARLCAAALLLAPASFALQAADAPAQDPSVEERLSRIEAENEELRRHLEILAAEIERFELRDVIPTVGESRYGLGPAASKVYARQQGLSIGGYGEMLYESFAGRARRDELDFLRAVLYAGYKFDQRWVFNSEIELEHATTSEEGVASVEFAYLDYLHSEELGARAGLLLLPMGFINELHEPTTFLEPTRPLTERVIIPSTWRENGAGLFGDLGQFSYRAYVVNGLRASGFSAGSGLRGGRQKGSRAVAEDLAVVARLDWEDDAGLLVGGSAYYGDSGQSETDLPDVGTRIHEAHLEYRNRGFTFRALGAMARLDDVAELNAALGLTGVDSIGEELRGFYLSLGYDLMPHLSPASTQSLTPFVRWETLDTQAKVPDGFDSSSRNDVEVLTFGINYKPIDQVVFKVGYQDRDEGPDSLQLVMGYVF